MSALRHSAVRHYRDDGPLVDLVSAVPRGLPRPLAALPLTLPLLGSFVALLLVPAGAAPETLAITVLAGVVLARVGRRSRHDGRLDWLVPPVLRLAEYAALLRLAVMAEPDAVPACYALLAALAYHHYDVVYRLRDRGEEPPVWLRRVGLGWEGRLLGAALLAHLGELQTGLYVAAAVLGTLYVVEGVLGWRRSDRHEAVDLDDPEEPTPEPEIEAEQRQDGERQDGERQDGERQDSERQP